MMWHSKSIADAIKISDNLGELESNFIHLRLFDVDKVTGVGIDGKGNTVLVLPGQNDALAFQTDFASYDPWSNLVVFETGTKLNGVSILRCDINLADEDTIEAAAAIFYGLLDLQEQFGKTGKAIWQLKSLFENRLKFDISDSIITGLIGELLIIVASDKPTDAVRFWHSNTDDKFDYSGANFRLEVKSTIGRNRDHHFSSHQIPGNAPEKTFIASAQIIKVESGMTLSNLLEVMKPNLDISDFNKVKETVFSILGVPEILLSRYQIDLDASLTTLSILPSAQVPRPEAEEDVLSMEWLARLDKNQSLAPFPKDFFNIYN